MVLAVDRSGSMAGEKIDSVKEAIPELLRHFDSGLDQVGLVTFAGRARLDQQLDEDFDETLSSIEEIHTDGATNLPDSLQVAIHELESSRHNPAAQQIIILLTDGESDVGGAEGIAARARAAGIRIIAIGLGDDADMATLTELAGGSTDTYHALTTAELVMVYEQIGARLDCEEGLR